MLPSLFIIIVNYNGFEDTIECVDSLFKSSVLGFTIIVVDNASTNDSVKKLEEYNSKNNAFVLIKSKTNGGFAAGNNIGIEYAMKRGADYVLLLNNDTVVDPVFIETIMNNTKPDIGINSCRIVYYDDKDRIWYNGGSFNPHTLKAVHYNYNDNQSAVVHNLQNETTFISGCCMFISSSVINTIGLLDESFFLYAEDLDYCIRATLSGIKMSFVDKPLVFHKVSASTGKRSELSQYYSIRNQILLLKKYNKGFIAFLCLYLQIAKRIISKEYSAKCAAKGVRDGMNLISGKAERFF